METGEQEADGRDEQKCGEADHAEDGRNPSPQPGGQARGQAQGVPDPHRQGDDGGEITWPDVAGSEPGPREAHDNAQRQRAEAEGHGAHDEGVQRIQRRQTLDVGQAFSLEASTHAQVQGGHRERQCEASKAREHQPDVKQEEDRRRVLATLRRGGYRGQHHEQTGQSQQDPLHGGHAGIPAQPLPSGHDQQGRQSQSLGHRPQRDLVEDEGQDESLDVQQHPGRDPPAGRQDAHAPVLASQGGRQVADQGDDEQRSIHGRRLSPVADMRPQVRPLVPNQQATACARRRGRSTVRGCWPGATPHSTRRRRPPVALRRAPTRGPPQTASRPGGAPARPSLAPLRPPPGGVGAGGAGGGPQHARGTRPGQARRI